MLNLITRFFFRNQVPAFAPPQDGITEFRAMVDRHVGNRKQIPDYMAVDPIYQVPKYVVLMCEDLCQLINKPYIKLTDVLRIEKTAVGHSDYQHKLALRCYLCTIENETIN